MHFSTPLLTLLAIAAGVQAAKPFEPPVHAKRVSMQGTAVSTGTHPIMTGGGTTNGTTGTNGTNTGGGGSGGSSSGGSSSGGSSSGGSSSGGAGGAGGAGSGASNTPASPSSTGFVPSNPGAKVSVPMVGAGLGSIAYGALIFLA